MTFQEALAHLAERGAVTKEGDLYRLGWYLSWARGSEEAVLDGNFSAKDLIAIATFMQGEQ